MQTRMSGGPPGDWKMELKGAMVVVLGEGDVVVLVPGLVIALVGSLGVVREAVDIAAGGVGVGVRMRVRMRVKVKV